MFKVGDRLRGTATYSGLPNNEVYEGEFRGEYGPASTKWPRVHGDDGENWILNPEKPITVVKTAPDLSFIGPKPEPAKEPTVILPFQVSPDEATFLEDANGAYLATFSGNETSYNEDKELAALVVRLLNEHFGVA